MALSQWTPVAWESLAGEGFSGLLEALEPLATDRKTLLRSDSGQIGVVISLEALNGAAGFELDLRAPPDGQRSMAVILTESEPLTEAVRSLGPSADFVAIPTTLSKPPPGFAPAGRLVQHVDPAVAESFQVLRPAAAAAATAERLTRGAPVDIGEGPDNLDSRERWFKKRHSSG